MVAALTKQALPKWHALLVEMGYDVCSATNKIHQHVVLNSWPKLVRAVFAWRRSAGMWTNRIHACELFQATDSPTLPCEDGTEQLNPL